MENFNQLLNQYIQRLGISDAELARAVGVSRQTIFRWREGTTARPRHREDVLAMAKKLRLTPDERDALLLAAGFRPEAEPEQTAVGEWRIETEEQAGARPSPKSKTRTEQSRSIQNLKWMGGFVATVILLLAVGAGSWWAFSGSATPTPTRINIAPAAGGETLVLVTHFANYASSQVGYNVAGRLADALQQEVETTHLQNIRIVVWPEAVGRRELALQAGQTVSATLVVYGEYDVGRVVVKMAHPANQNIFVDPALQRHVAGLQDLSATINTDLPRQVRSLALLALGQIYLQQGDMSQAQLLLARARNSLRGDTSVDEKTWGLVNFYLGVAYQHNDPPNLDEAIAAYSQAIEAWPTMISSRLNRGAAYEARKQPGDLERALADAQAVVEIAPEWASAYNNRASIRMNIGGPENLELALADLEKTLELNPELPEAYVNQAFIYFRQGRPMREVTPVLEQALSLRPGYGTALNALCWGYGLEQQPDVAMPYCQQAVAAEPNRALYQDSRGLVYALLGDYPAAIADFQAYIKWLEAQPRGTFEQQLVRRREWVEALERGESPFTPAVLAELRNEFGE